MKKIFTYICAAFLVLGLASCAKEDITTPEKTGKMTIIATLEDAVSTKTSLVGNDEKGYKVVWSAGDIITINYNNKPYPFILTNGAGTTTGEFTCELSSITFADGTYDACHATTFSQTEGFEIYFSYDPTFSESVTPMKTTLTIKNGVASVARFKNLCGLLRLDVTGYGILETIKVETDKNISGPFSVDDKGSAVIKNSSISRKSVQLRLVTQEKEIKLSSEVQSFYLPLPEGDYSNVKISFMGPSGGLCEMTLNSGKKLSIKRSEIYPISFNANIISGQLSRKSGGRIKWVQLWENGPKWAICNVGADNDNPLHSGGWYKQLTPYGYTDNAIDQWGEYWKTPSVSEFQELINLRTNYTVVEDVIVNGSVVGSKYTGKGIFEHNSIILPAANYSTHPGPSYNRSLTAYRIPGKTQIPANDETYLVVRAVVKE